MKSSFSLFGVTFYPYSILMIVGVVVCLLLFMLLSFRRHRESAGENLFALEMLVLSAAAALPAAMVLDSLFKMAETGRFEWRGATFYGGLLGALALFPLLLRFKKNRTVTIAARLNDLAPCIPAGHFFGRIGCFLGGCCFGKPTGSEWGVVFPEGSMPWEFYGGPVRIHPTQLYEAVLLLSIFIVLLLFAKENAFPFYLILYGAGRIVIECFRNDDRGLIPGVPLSPAQLISAVLIVVGILLLLCRIVIQKKKNLGNSF